MRVISMKGSVSGGTIYSFLNILEESRKTIVLKKYLITLTVLVPDKVSFETEEEDLKKLFSIVHPKNGLVHL